MTGIAVIDVGVPLVGFVVAVVGLPILYLRERRIYHRDVATASSRVGGGGEGPADDLVFEPWPHEELRHIARGSVR